MKSFAVLLQQLTTWLTSFSWVNQLMPLRLLMLFGGLGLSLADDVMYRFLFDYSSGYRVYDFLFNTIPLSSIGAIAFLAGAWLTLVSPDVKLLPIGLWGKAFVILFPFSGWFLNSLLMAAMYVWLGYLLYRFTASAEATNPNQTTSM
ncbi:MAG: hypothetical protein J7639_17540 [Paenibacillaceae bacterium]|nr:hypothetical protein [Paenibacillaceae bacterium]